MSKKFIKASLLLAIVGFFPISTNAFSKCFCTCGSGHLGNVQDWETCKEACRAEGSYAKKSD